MSKYDMCEALYALPGGVVVKRRKPIAVPALLLAAGVAILVINSQIEASVEMMNLKSALVLFGAVAAVVGAVMLALRLTGSAGTPYHAADGCYLQCKELKFNKEKSAQLRDLVNRGDFATLRSLPEDGVSAVTVVIYSSPRSGFCAAQVFEYFELELRAVSELKVTDK
ncbi:MAG: hypothetical protein IJ976_04725 [Alistipes sp.]|nr:hypothetical protein [Alistipes sp.]